jgi:hypothetical protein
MGIWATKAALEMHQFPHTRFAAESVLGGELGSWGGGAVPIRCLPPWNATTIQIRFLESTSNIRLA